MWQKFDSDFVVVCCLSAVYNGGVPRRHGSDKTFRFRIQQQVPLHSPSNVHSGISKSMPLASATARRTDFKYLQMDFPIIFYTL